MQQDTCIHCAGPVPPAAGARVRLYCSPICKQRAKDARKTERYRTDSNYRRQVRDRQTARARESGVQPMRRRDPVCSMPDCNAEHFCRGMCRKHYRRLLEDEGRGEQKVPTVLLQGMASLYGAFFPKVKTIKCKVPVGVTAECPWCRARMAATSPSHRVCRSCGTTVQLNPEEVSWLVSEKRSSRQSQQTAN